MSTSVTERQRQCLDFIREYMGEKGVAPSYQEIAVHLGLKSKSNVTRLVQSLIERGAVRKHGLLARTLELVEGHGFWVNPIPEVRMAIAQYAAEHNMPIKTAAEQALRAYFMEASTG